MVNWGELNPDVVVEISRRIKLYEDFVAFRGVCVSWRSVTIKETFKYKDSQMPWLMLAPKKGTHLRDFFSISKGMTRQTALSYQLNGGTCFSSKGWLVAVLQDWSMNLVHPFSDTQIKLPHIKSFSHWRCKKTRKIYASFIHKCVLSSGPSPTTSDFTVMVIYGSYGQLAYCKRGDKAWTTIDTWYSCYSDVIYYKGKFYALNCLGQIMLCDVGGDNPTVAQQVAHMPHELYIQNFERLYMVESAGELLVISRKEAETSDATSKFNIFKVDLSNNTWTNVEDLGNRAVFLGHNSSFSIEALHNSFCKPNCIYFTDDNVEAHHSPSNREGGGKDMGIYSLQEKGITPCYGGKISCHRISPPMWVEQSFYF